MLRIFAFLFSFNIHFLCVVILYKRRVQRDSIPKSHHHHHWLLVFISEVWTMIVWSEYIQHCTHRVVVIYIKRASTNLTTIYLSVYCFWQICASNVPFLKFCDFLIHIMLCCYVYVQTWKRKNKENKDYCWARSWAACGYYVWNLDHCILHAFNPSSLLNAYIMCICRYILKRVRWYNNDGYANICVSNLCYESSKCLEKITLCQFCMRKESTNRLSFKFSSGQTKSISFN